MTDSWEEFCPHILDKDWNDSDMRLQRGSHVHSFDEIQLVQEQLVIMRIFCVVHHCSILHYILKI